MNDRIRAVRLQIDIAAAQIEYTRQQLEIVKDGLNIIIVALAKLEAECYEGSYPCKECRLLVVASPDEYCKACINAISKM